MRRRASLASPAGQLRGWVSRSSRAWRVMGKNFSRAGGVLALSAGRAAAATLTSALHTPPRVIVPADVMFFPPPSVATRLPHVERPRLRADAKPLEQEPVRSRTGRRRLSRLAGVWD